MLAWPDATIYEALAGVAADRGGEPALYVEGEAVGYDALLDRTRALAAGLADLGVGPGDLVAVWLSNRPAWIEAQLAASRLGAAAVAVNTRYRTHELEYMLRDSGATALLTEASFLGRDYLAMLAEVVPAVREHPPDEFAAESVPALEHVIAVGASDRPPAARAYEDVVSTGRTAPTPEPATDPERPACVFYTSGTTSDPKGCLQTNRSLLNHSHRAGRHLGFGDGEVVLGALPFCGVWGYNVLLAALAHGRPLVVQSHFEPGTALALIEAHGVTAAFCQAAMFERMLDHDSFAPGRVASVERGVVAFLSRGVDEALFERIEAGFGFPPVQPYGLSEGNSMIFVGQPDDQQARRKRVGGPMIHPDEEARVVDPETGEGLPPGEAGELCLRGFNVMEGYLGKPEQTAAAFDDDGWLHTGDLAVREADGSLYFRARLDDALRVRGFLVAPREVETVLDDHPGVALSQVVGADHPRHGQVPVAFVRRADGSPSEAELCEYLGERVADFKVPEAVEFVESFPRTEGPHGAKIQKHELRERVAGRFARGGDG